MCSKASDHVAHVPNRHAHRRWDLTLAPQYVLADGRQNKTAHQRRCRYCRGSLATVSLWSTWTSQCNTASARTLAVHHEVHSRANAEACERNGVTACDSAPPNRMKFADLFRKFAHRTSMAVGSPNAFILALVLIVAWAISGPLFHYSDTWQLVINTSTTIVTFLMVFLIQSTQNRESVVTQLKLDELLRAIRSARNKLVDLEDLSDMDLQQLQTEFKRVAHQASNDEQGVRSRRERKDSTD